LLLPWFKATKSVVTGLSYYEVAHSSEALDLSSRWPSHFLKEKGTSLQIGFLVQPEKYGVHLVENRDQTMDFVKTKLNPKEFGLF
jgi:hypothetical protein